jgi:ABC-type branched-subunit amino acid transport system ATPase component
LAGHNAAMVPRLGSRGFLLKIGRGVAEGETRAATTIDRVPKAFLGI